MNLRLLTFALGEIALVVGALMCIPMFMAIGYGDDTVLSFGIAIAVCVVFGVIGIILRPAKDKRDMRSSSGFAMCALFWIFVALISAIPFRISGYIPNYLDAFFETVSGYTTTGATTLSNVEVLPKSLLFWRSLTQYVGGMGVLVFVIVFLPKNDKMSTALAKAETPGPQYGKLVSKLRFTSIILYAIYIVLTFVLVGILCACKMPVFDSFCHAFATASTGGFPISNVGVGSYNSVAIEIVITVFMLLFSINFTVFFALITGHILKALKSEEVLWFIGLFVGFVAIIVTNLCVSGTYDNFALALKDTAFSVSSFMSTTGFVTADFTSWPILSKLVIMLAMCIGGCAGSTAGGLKVSRVIMLTKSSAQDVKKVLSPRAVLTVKMDGKRVDDVTLTNVRSFFIVYIFIIIISTLLISIGNNSLSSFDGFGSFNAFETNFSAVISCFNNIGPGFGAIGIGANYANYSVFAKLVLCFDMLLGRLEIWPMLLLFSVNSWKRIKK